jgi:hypothetical protein
LLYRFLYDFYFFCILPCRLVLFLFVRFFILFYFISFHFPSRSVDIFQCDSSLSTAVRERAV